MSSILKPRVFASAGVLALAAGCALLLAVPRLVALDITTANVTLPAKEKSPDLVRVGVDQVHQLAIVPVVTDQFRIQKMAIGQIAFNEDASTIVLTPFSGRVTRLIAKIGDDVKRGDPLFEIDRDRKSVV